MRFAELGELPSYVRLAALDEGQGVEATLKHHSAKWHKSCRDNFNTTKLNRAEKRKQAKAHTVVVDNGPVYAEIPFAGCPNEPHFTRSTIAAASGSNACCFFSDQSDGTLHNVTTFEFDARVRSFAYLLQDSKLIAKLSSGDMIATEAKYHNSCLLILFNRAKAAEKTIPRQLRPLRPTTITVLHLLS
jgi:hypothetical protein